MVHRQSTHIQQSTASLLKFHPEHLELTIQGLDSCVDLAAKELKMILEDADPKKALKPTSSSSDDDHNTRNLPIINEILSPTDIIQINSSSECKVRNCNSFTGDERLCQEHNINNDITESYLETDSCCISDKIDSHMPFNIPSHSSQHSVLNKKSSASSSSAVESDEDNCIVHNVLTDSRNSKQVEQAVKLGYSLNQIETALEKLGPGCTSDNLLSELIKIGNEQSDTLTHLDDLVDEVITLPLNDISLVSRNSENSKRTSPLPPAFKDLDASENLRSIVIDGSNVAMSHGQDRFSCKGIKIAVDWFRKRGHTDITVFVPQWRKEASRPDAPIEDQQILHELERERIMTFTPSRRVQGRRIVSYDDRYVLKHAVDVDGIVVSNDVYRDLVRENEGFRKVVDQHLLMYTFVKDKFMPPDDPLGRLGPSLDDFLRKVPSEPAPKPQDCPYGKKCTYGNKCRFYHPERGFTTQKSITDTLKEQANISFQEIAAKKSDAASEKGKRQKQKLARTKSLIPGEMVSPNATPDSSLSEAIGKSKPKLGHSKSLISPTKTGDYLTASRLKLEQAELIENSRKSSLQEKDITLLDDFVSSQKVQKRRKGSSDVRSYSPSPRASPAPSNESILMGNLLNKNFTPSGIWDNLPMTPAHLAVPNSQPQESYSSGHLSVAKKLSDEGSEKNFFMGNKSSPSPPSSLLDDLSPYEEKKLKEQANLSQKNNGGSQTLIIGKEPLEHHTFTVGPVEDNYQSQNAVDFSHSFDDVLSPVSGHIPSMDSGNFSMYGSPQPMMSPQIFPSYPPATKKDNRRYHQGLHRSLSTSHSLKGPEHFLRQTSDVNEHLQLRQQQSTPLFPQHFQNTKEPLLGTLLRQNSSSNPDIYAWPDRCDSGKGLDCETVYHSAPLPRDDKVQSQQPHLISNSHIPGHQLNVHYGAYQFPGPQGTNSSKHNPIRDTSNTLSSYPPTAQPRRAPESNFAYQVPHSLQQHTLPLQSHCQSQVFYPYQLQQPMMYSSDMTSPQSPFYGHPLYQTQSFPPFDSRGTANQGHFSRHSMPQHQHRPDFPQTPSVHQGNPVPLDQEALIPRDDSRYKAFCQLSPVFGEKAVRTFMNRNPDVKDLNQLFNLISAFKVETGM